MDLAAFAVESKTCLSVNSRGTNKEYHHLYLSRVYGPLFKQLHPIKKVLEIGIGGGCSAELWLKFLSPELIIAVDTDWEFYRYLRDKNLPKVRPIFGDAYSQTIVGKLPTNLDLVIDDGPHSYWALKAAIRIYLKKLRPGGVLLVEDIDSIEMVLSKLLLSADENLVCCSWVFDSRLEAREKHNSVALLIHRKGSICSLNFEQGKEVFKPTFYRSLIIKQVLVFEKCSELLNRKIYHGIKFRIANLISFFLRVIKVKPN